MNRNQQQRIVRIQQHLAENGLDAMLVTSQDSIFYLSGASYTPLERPFFIVVHRSGVPDIVVPELEREHMSKVDGFGAIRSYFEYPSLKGENWYDRLAELTGESAVLGIEPSLSVNQKSLIRAKEVIVCDVIDRMRMVKDKEELEAIRLAAHWTDIGMGMLHNGLYRGQSVVETSMYAKNIQTGVIKTTDYNYMTSSFLTAGWPAPKSSQPHSLPDLNMRMQNGPLVLMSFNRVNGYAAECERTVFLGEPSESDRELFRHMMKARELAYSMVRPGVCCGEIDLATQEYFREQGFGSKIIHRAGHGIGMGNHEAPWLSAGSDHVLQENMVISIEPAIYFGDIGGFRHSDTVLVTKDGFERITRYPDTLDELIVSEKRVLKQLKGKVIRSAINFKDR